MELTIKRTEKKKNVEEEILSGEKKERKLKSLISIEVLCCQKSSTGNTMDNLSPDKENWPQKSELTGLSSNDFKESQKNDKKNYFSLYLMVDTKHA